MGTGPGGTGPKLCDHRVHLVALKRSDLGDGEVGRGRPGRSWYNDPVEELAVRLGTGCISKDELTGLADGLDSGREEREESKTPRFWLELLGGWSCHSLRCGQHMALLSTESKAWALGSTANP